MKEYNELVLKVLEEGTCRYEPRTNTDILSLFGVFLEIDMSNGFPLLTSKKMAFNTMAVELEWFINGRSDLKYLLERNCNIWTGDAFRAYGASYAKYLGVPIENFTIEMFRNGVLYDDKYFDDGCDLGPIYGAQWRGTYDGITSIAKIPPDQLYEVVEGLKKEPFARRHVVMAWNPLVNKDMVLPPCWAAGSLVNMADGRLEKIENVKIGDYVLTEDGSCQKVYDSMVTKFSGDMIELKLSGSRKPFVSTFNHPYLVRGRGYIDAELISNGDYLGIPINKKSIIPKINITIKDNQYFSRQLSVDILDDDLWYLMGYFLGDGWLDRRKKSVVFVINDNQINSILPILRKNIGLAKINNSGKNCTKFVGKKTFIFELLSMFGHGAANKIIPSFVFDAPKDKIEFFLKGYKDADGCDTNDGSTFTTVSDSIAYGIQMLYAKLGVRATVIYQERPSKKIIEGRIVNQKNTYSINISKNKNKSLNYIFDEDFLWLRVNSIKRISSVEKAVNVYNLSVENNHTYCVSNIINHNCHLGFQLYMRDVNGQMYLDLLWMQRSADIALGIPFNIGSYALLLELIAKEVGALGGFLKASIGDAHIYASHVENLEKQVMLDLYPLPKIDISQTSLWNFEASKVKLIDYKSHDRINFKLYN